MAEHDVPVSSAAAGHELSDLSPKNIGWFGVGLTALIIAGAAVCYLLFHYFYTTVTRARPQPSPLSFSREPTPEPRLEVKPGEDLKAVRAQEDAILKSYGWVDPDKGIVRIPIDRAIDILSQRGLPVREESKAAKGKFSSKEKH